MYPDATSLPQSLQAEPHTCNQKKTCNIFNRRPAHLFLISAAIVMKVCSTLVAFLALVSKKGIPISSAKAWFPEQKIRWTRKSVRTNRDRQQPRPGTVEPDQRHHHKLHSPPPNTPKSIHFTPSCPSSPRPHEQTTSPTAQHPTKKKTLQFQTKPHFLTIHDSCTFAP